MPRMLACFSPCIAVAIVGAAVGFSDQSASGQTWQAGTAGSDVPNGSVLGLKMWDPDGAGPQPPVLVAIGSFTAAGTVSPANRVATWDGTNWSTMPGTGLNAIGSTAGLATLSSNNTLYCAGTGLSSANGVSAKGVAGWDGSTWFGLDSTSVAALLTISTVNADTIVACGVFSNVNGVVSKNVATWNTTAGWGAMGTGLSSNPSSCLGMSDGHTIIVSFGADYTGTTSAAPGDPGAVQVNRIARWDGSAWHAMGSGFTTTNATLHPAGIARTLLEMPNGDVIAGGSFVASGATALNKIARWDHSTDTWVAMGSGINNDTGSNHDVYALALMGNGDVVAAGDFTTSIGAPQNYIARWNPATSTWTAMAAGDLGVAGAVRSLATLPNGNLAVGGDFLALGDGRVAQRFAIWNEPAVAVNPPVITVEPTSQFICIFPGAVGTFHLTATGGGLTYQWQQQDLGPTFPDFIDISDGPVLDIFGHPIFTAAGATTNTLTLSDGQGFGQIFRCHISNAAGQTDSAEVGMLYCRADFNCSGSLEVQDIFGFLAAWFAGAPGADFNFDNEVGVQDIFDFLAGWFDGC